MSLSIVCIWLDLMFDLMLGICQDSNFVDMANKLLNLNFFFPIFCLFQISAEFSRIVTKDLMENFLAGLDSYMPSLLQLYRSAVGSGQKMGLQGVMDSLLKEVSTGTSCQTALLARNTLWHFNPNTNTHTFFLVSKRMIMPMQICRQVCLWRASSCF